MFLPVRVGDRNLEIYRNLMPEGGFVVSAPVDALAKIEEIAGETQIIRLGEVGGGPGQGWYLRLTGGRLWSIGRERRAAAAQVDASPGGAEPDEAAD